MPIQDYLDALDSEQMAAVKHSGSPLLILAGAGSGKTRVITTKIAWLITQCGFSPYEILAVTFTNKAAREMRDRVTAMEERAIHTELRTFHSFGAWFLRRFHEEAGLNPNFTIYDDDDAVTLLSQLIPHSPRAEIKSILNKISRAKDYCYTPEDPKLDEIESDQNFRHYYELYQNRLDSIGNLDFGDLILKPVQLLNGNDQVREAIQKRFRVILVDEYQDSNVAQFKLLQALIGPKTYICAVGDEDQSIYKFRGAEIQNILSFPESFQGTEIIRLERNYRSVEPVLNVANDIIKNNSERLGKTLRAERLSGKKPALVFLDDQDQEARFVTDLIVESHNRKGVPYSDWAVLYRTNAQSLSFESAFLHNKIPYQVIGSLKFYEREEIKDALAYLALSANPRDEVAFRRVVNKPTRGVGTVTQDKIMTSAMALYDGDFIQAASNTAGTFAKKASEGLKTFVTIIKELSPMLVTENQESNITAMARTAISETLFDFDEATANQENTTTVDSNETTLAVFVRRLIELSGLDEYHKAQDEVSGTQRIGNLQELVNNASLYPLSADGLTQFLEHIELDRTALASAEENDNNGNVVTLITLHNTKGLEFPRVVMAGLELGIFPRENKMEEELEEERRLMYVGITRARDELYFTSATMRRMYGKTSYMIPSPFLSEIDPSNIDILGKVPRDFAKGNNKASTTKTTRNVKIETFGYDQGTAVYHDDYGYGSVISVSSSPEGETVIMVQFENSGTKRFLPKYQANALLKVQQDGDEF